MRNFKISKKKRIWGEVLVCHKIYQIYELFLKVLRKEAPFCFNLISMISLLISIKNAILIALFKSESIIKEVTWKKRRRTLLAKTFV